MARQIAVPACPKRAVDLPALTGLRIVGAAWVVLYHFQTTLYEALPGMHLMRPILSHGDAGVPLFFVLSGFIIWHNYGCSSTLTARASASFLWRRFARLWPVNLVSAGVALIIVSVHVHHYGNWGAPTAGWYSITGWLQSAFMIDQVGKGDVEYAWNQPSWSLSAELWAYLMFLPLLALFLAVGRRRPQIHALWLLPALVLAYGSWALPGSFPYSWLARLTALFICGVCLRLAGEPRSRQGGRLLVSMQVLAPALIVFACYTGLTDALGVLLALWVYSLSLGRGRGFRFFANPAAQAAGGVSYSLYMVHWSVFAVGALLVHEVPAVREVLWLYAISALAVTGLASWALWRWCETPSRNGLNRLFDRMWPPSQSVPTATRAATRRVPNPRRGAGLAINR
ncbi:MAG: acyltransferase family protein [Sporichthyaceae bacterium]